jgi:hypothetical protein
VQSAVPEGPQTLLPLKLTFDIDTVTRSSALAIRGAANPIETIAIATNHFAAVIGLS